MKKLLSAFLCLCLLFSLCPAFADSVSEVMRVSNCTEWVSLREKASSSSTRLMKVHLGELVTDCVDAGNGFVRCSFGDKTGYIASQYLTKTDHSTAEGILPNQMVIHCSEWVSLRKEPNTSSTRLAKVPLGGVVTECVSWMGSFVCCTYMGQRGYIASEYLTDADWTWLDNLDAVYPPINGSMEVVDCKDWVSLRELPSTASDRLSTVPLGAIVENCEQVSEEYISCTYNGQHGYIQKKYLREITSSASSGQSFQINSKTPAITDLVLQGNTALITMAGNNIILAQRVYSSEGENLIVACYNHALSPVWSLTVTSPDVAELSCTDAFIAGTAMAPVLVTFKAGQGFTAFGIDDTWTGVLWECTDPAARNVSGSICHAVADNGTIYVCGYYDAAPIAISASGSLLWKAQNEDSNVFWPYRIQLSDDSVNVLYDSCDWSDSLCYQVKYDKAGVKQLQQLVTSPQAQ